MLRGLEEGLSASNNLMPIMAGIASDVAGAFAVKLAMPSFGDASGNATVSGNREAQSVTTVTVIQNNPVTRDPLKQLREESEMVAAGVWG